MMKETELGEECAQGMPGPGRGSLGREDQQGLTMTSVIPVLQGQGGCICHDGFFTSFPFQSASCGVPPSSHTAISALSQGQLKHAEQGAKG